MIFRMGNESMEKGCWLKDFADGQKIEGQFLVSSLTRAETRAGKPYLTLKVMDRTGDMTARIWDNADRWQEECKPGKVIQIQAQVQSYKGNLQLIINGVQGLAAGDVDMAAFVPAAPRPVAEMAEELRELAGSVSDENLQRLLGSFLDDDDFTDRFFRAPAAKNMHHAYLGGLLEHSLAVMRLAAMVAGIYPSIDRSLLLAGAMLHDIGKVREFSYETPPFDYSDRGRLVGHMVIGVEMVQQKIGQIGDFPEELSDRLKHLILSHHGRHEFGAPALPMLHEAFVLNFLDDMDSKINYVEKLSSRLEDEGYQWSEYQRTLERFLFLSGPGTVPLPEEGPGEKVPVEPDEDKKTDFRQPSLF